jgi:hypothetical protein
VALACSLVPVDIYEWAHVFECLLRAGRLDAMDMHSFLYRPANAAGHRWADLARWRMRLDYLRVTAPDAIELDTGYRELIEAYDRGGLPYERCLVRLGQARWLLSQQDLAGADEAAATVRALARRYLMHLVEADAAHIVAAIARCRGDVAQAVQQEGEGEDLRQGCGFHGPPRP